MKGHKRTILCGVLLSVLFPLPSFGQLLGVMGGSSYYIGELNPYQHFDEETRYAGGLFYRDAIDSRWVLRTHLFYGTVAGSDADAASMRRRNRNLHFRSDVVEAAVMMELNFFDYQFGDMGQPLSPYLFTGLAYFRMNPEARYEGQWHELQPLGTEGQGVPGTGREKYSLDQISIPFGLGVKWNLGEKVALSFEWGMRKTFTDYLDDVSRTYIDEDRLREANGELAAELADRRLEKGDGRLAGKDRGVEGTNDWYVFSGVMLSFKIGKEGSVCSSFNTGR